MRRSIFLLVSMLLASLAWSQELRATLFADADAARQSADNEQAALLAPQNYSEASRYYERAEQRLADKGNIDRIKADLARATTSWSAARDAAKIAAVSLADTMRARADALKSEAPKFAPDGWQEAQRLFSSAAQRLESGDLNGARSRGVQASTAYRAAELGAIKTQYLDEARQLIQRARNERVARYAPRTLAHAEALLTEADSALERNRYDVDEPRSLAREARAEAAHALSLAARIGPVRDGAAELETLLLQSEKPLRDVAAQLDLSPTSDVESTVLAQQIIEAVTRLQKDSQLLGERNTQIANLEAELGDLETKLGRESARRAQQERLRDRLRQTELMFPPEEALVYQQGNDLLLRLVGLTFPSGRSTVETSAYTLLGKVRDVLTLFSPGEVLIEGHTDSFGSDEANLELSAQRALSVREYLLANTPGLDPDKVTAQGYGETQPIASNDSAEGRGRNRRIDVVLRGALVLPVSRE
ncbi:MAG: OmpA family protein [Steroidobacteraceae bacterium]